MKRFIFLFILGLAIALLLYIKPQPKFNLSFILGEKNLGFLGNDTILEKSSYSINDFYDTRNPSCVSKKKYNFLRDTLYAVFGSPRIIDGKVKESEEYTLFFKLADTVYKFANTRNQQIDRFIEKLNDYLIPERLSSQDISSLSVLIWLANSFHYGVEDTAKIDRLVESELSKGHFSQYKPREYLDSVILDFSYYSSFQQEYGAIRVIYDKSRKWITGRVIPYSTELQYKPKMVVN